MPGVDEVAFAAGADEEAADLVQRLLGGGKADALERTSGQRLQALQRQGEVRAALVADEGVDLVHDDRPHRGQDLPPAVAGQQEIERLRRGDQDVRRPLAHGRALRGRRVARSAPYPHFGQGRIQGADLAQRSLEVLLHVVGERAQGRDVEDARLVGQRAPFLQQRVDGGQEGGQRLAGSGGRGDQDVPALADEGPALTLGRRRLAETVGEPALDDGVEGGERRHGNQLLGRLDRRTSILIRPRREKGPAHGSVRAPGANVRLRGTRARRQEPLPRDGPAVRHPLLAQTPTIPDPPFGPLSWQTRIAPPEEPGDPLVVSGQVFDPAGVKPVPGVVVYAYHTDIKGLYTPSGAQRPPRLQGWARTDADGRYEFRTIRPAPYPGNGPPAHVHFYLSGAGYPQQEAEELQFADDPRVGADASARRASRGPLRWRPARSRAEQTRAWRCTFDMKLHR